MSENKTITIFPFADPDIKYTMMDNYLFDYIMPQVKPNAWKVLCLVVRKTTGWHKKKDQLSYSQIRDGTGISSQSTVQLAIKELINKNLIIQAEGSTKWDAFIYSLNCQFSVTVSVTEGDAVSTETVTVSVTNNVIEPVTETVNTKESEIKGKKQPSSATADYSRPISLLSEKEVKELKLPLSEWQQHLVDEQEERNRKGVIKFIEGKIRYGQLRPVNEDELKLFEILAVEYEADGGKAAPGKFPTLETKHLFNEAAQFHNGTLENVIRKAIHKRGKGIAKIVDYISSPKWQENKNGQSRTRTGQPHTYGQASENQSGAGDIPLGSGQTPEMRARLEAHFGGG